MKEAFTMWRYTQMIVLVALSAAIYAAVLIPFKGFVVIPGHSELRPANVFPFVFGLLFGPAGAWGSAIGNLIGDFFGTLSPGSIAGFIGNFFLAMLPYKLWGALSSRRNIEPDLRSGRKVALYILIAFIASTFCALVIAWWLDLLGLVPFEPPAVAITFNNTIAGVVLGPFLLLVLYPRVKRWGLLWTEIMRPEEVSPARFAKVGAVLAAIGGIGGVTVGLLVSLGIYENTPGGLGVSLGLIPFVLLGVISAFMLGGRRQVEAVQEELDEEPLEEEASRAT